MRNLINYTTVAGIAFVLAASFHLDSAWPEPALSDAQAQAQAEMRKELAAAKLCRQAHGESGYTWTIDNQLVCLPRTGKSVIAKEGL